MRDRLSTLRIRSRCSASVLALIAALVAAPALTAQIPTPASVLGFKPGTDRKLVEWPTLVRYYRALATASDRVQFRELGKTTLGAPFVALVISSPQNLARLGELRAINAKLADPRTITSPQERARLIHEGRTVVLITSSIHSTEVGGHLSPTVIAYRLASGNSPEILKILDRTIVLLVPSLNPDGVTIVSHWYNRTLGTPAEGTPPPELYHHYVGHDNNRDWYAFTQVETQLTVDSLYSVWHPQIVHDIHQQGSYGSRFFLPPYRDPWEPNVDPLLVAGVNALGTAVAWQLIGEGKTGIVVNSTYDAWTPARAYPHYHAAVRILSEAASAALATPIDVPFERLVGRRGFDAQKSSWNFPAPWPGGRWTLADILDYQVSGAFALLDNAAAEREVWLRNFVEVGERAVRGWPDWPYAYAIPKTGQNPIALDVMLGILRRGGVEIRTATAPFRLRGTEYPTGTYVVVLRQPYAAFAKTLLERQDYPDLRQYPGGPPRAPYDVTAHTLPLLMGVHVALAEAPVPIALSDSVASIPAPAYAYPGLSVSPGARPEHRPRIGLYKSYTASIDEGWTRWIFDTWHVPYVSLVDSVVRAGRLRDRFDVIVIPDMRPGAIRDGLPATYPAPYPGGLGEAGESALRDFVRAGGTLVALNKGTEFARNLFANGPDRLPVHDVLAGLSDQAFYAPGSIFRIAIDTTSPLARNMPAASIAWFERGPAFEVTDSARARVIAHYPVAPERVLLSGWVLHPERVAGKAALVDVKVGRGRVVLFGFRPQYRGQSIATYPLLFNALMSSGAE